MIGIKISRHFPNQSDAKPQPMAPCIRNCSRVCKQFSFRVSGPLGSVRIENRSHHQSQSWENRRRENRNGSTFFRFRFKLRRLGKHFCQSSKQKRKRAISICRNWPVTSASLEMKRQSVMPNWELFLSILTLLFKYELFGNERVSQIGKTDAFHLRTGRSVQPVLTNGTRPKIQCSGVFSASYIKL